MYRRTQEANLVRVQDSGTMGAILGKNTFKFSSRVMDDDRSSEKTLISEGMTARGRPLCHPAPHPTALLLSVPCYVKNIERGH